MRRAHTVVKTVLKLLWAVFAGPVGCEAKYTCVGPVRIQKCMGVREKETGIAFSITVFSEECTTVSFFKRTH